jgi:uncharacterized membrane protein
MAAPETVSNQVESESMRLIQRPVESTHEFNEMSVWHEWPDEVDGAFQHQSRPNIGSPERIASVLGGGTLAGYGITRKSVPGYVLAALGGYLALRGITGRCSLYRSLGIDTSLDGRAEPRDFFERGIHVSQSIIINRSQEDLYRYWRDFANLPSIMSHLKSVEIMDHRRSHWVADGPLHSSIEWDAEIINEEPNELIAWRSLEDAEVHSAGSVRFVPVAGHRGTQVRVELEYIPTGGRLGAAIAKLFGKAPGQQIKEDLRRFKQKMETGEVATTQGQPRGTCKS